MKLLITSGATREPIDGVRFITNFSTGRTGAKLADFFTELGFGVTYLRGEGAAEPACECNVLTFSDFRDLDEKLRRELARGEYFAVIHLAAVSDYAVERIQVGERSYSPGELKKLDSQDDGVGIVLKRNFKIVDRLKSYAPTKQNPRVVAFKLTNASDPQAARRAVERVVETGSVDAVVHNDLAQFQSSAEHRFEFFSVSSNESGGSLGSSRVCSGTDELGTLLVDWFKESLKGGRA